MSTPGFKEELIDMLKAGAVFSVLSADELEELAAAFEPRYYTPAQTVVRAGDQSDAFYIVYAGRAEVVAERTGGEIVVGTLTRGYHLGEQGLVRSARREFTVRALDGLVLLRLWKQDFENLLAAHPEVARYFEQYISEVSIRNFLKLCTVFAPLSDAAIRDLLRCLETREYVEREVIVREGDPGDAFFILRSGEASVIKESQGGRILNRLQAGDFFGELALLTGQPRAASVVAVESASVFRLEKRDFDRILTSAPEARQAFSAAAVRYGQDAAHAPGTQPEEPPGQTPAPAYQPKHARRYPAVLQASAAECGPACLSAVLRYYRKDVSANRIRALAPTNQGASLDNLAESAAALGFNARGIHAQFEHLGKVELPAIAQWEGSHYMVLYAVRDDGVVVADPAFGLRRLTGDEFRRGWSGELLLLAPTPHIEGLEQAKGTLPRLLQVVRPYRRQLAQIILLSVCLEIFSLTTPIFTQVVVDRVIVQKNISILNTMFFGMLIVAACQALTVALRQYLMVHTSRRIDLSMAVNFYRHALSLPLRFFEERRVGDIIKRFSDNEKVRELLTGRGFLSALDCITVLVYYCMMLYYSVRLTLLLSIFMAGYAILSVAVTPTLKRLNREMFQRAAQTESNLVESIAGIVTVKATAAERPVRWKWEGLLVKALNVRFRSAMTDVTVGASSAMLQSLSSTFLLWYGARLVVAGEFSIGQLMAFTTLAASITMPVLLLVELWSQFQDVTVGMERLNEVFDTRPEESPGNAGLVRMPPVSGHVRFEGVTFSYPGRSDRKALDNVDLEVLPGQTVALVGRSGAGKSTFAGLLLRMHVPSQGRILIDGCDLCQVSVASLRSQIGVVPQDVELFSGTIRENIAFSDPDSPLEEVTAAARLAGAHEFILALPDGYQTTVGERGQSLSGGQKQRIAIARALLKRPRILIFDEATSALDNESERAIQQNLDNILRGRTTFVIAHRLTTVRNADKIVVLDAGRIVESGTHYSLMEQRGLYYYLSSQRFAEG